MSNMLFVIAPAVVVAVVAVVVSSCDAKHRFNVFLLGKMRCVLDNEIDRSVIVSICLLYLPY